MVILDGGDIADVVCTAYPVFEVFPHVVIDHKHLVCLKRVGKVNAVLAKPVDYIIRDAD